MALSEASVGYSARMYGDCLSLSARDLEGDFVELLRWYPLGISC
jgi:hypothetical protein